MKKLLAISALALILSGPAFAEDAAAPDHKGPGPMFERADTNHDGLLSKEEFMAKHEETFKRLDTNGDGSISKEEIEVGREKWKEMRKEHMEQKDGAAPAETPAEPAPAQ